MSFDISADPIEVAAQAREISADPIVLAAQAREILAGLHKRNDTVVRFKTDRSGYSEDALSEIDKEVPGHFRTDRKYLTLNLDSLLNGKSIPSSLGTIEDWRKYPILAGVAAHESGHARWSSWDDGAASIPEFLPNPNFDPAHPEPKMKNPNFGKPVKNTGRVALGGGVEEEVEPEFIPDPDYKGPEKFRVSETGKLMDVAKLLEEPRIERLGVSNFTKTWRRAMQFSASHLILERVDEDDAEGRDPLDAALNLAILVGGRQIAGTLGVSHESRQGVRKVLASAQKIIETALAEKMKADPKFDPYHEIMSIVNEAVFSDDHDDSISHLERARRILEIIHPENADDPDSDGGGKEEGEEGTGSGSGSGMPGAGSSASGDDESEEGDGSSSGSEAARQLAQAMAEAMREAKKEMTESLDDLVQDMKRETKVEQEQPDAEGMGGFGVVRFLNERAPQIARYESPTTQDREMYRKALNWMENRIAPTVTQSEVDQWLPTGGARLDVRSHIRDNMAGHVLNQRTDWSVVSETVKPAPPVKLAVMLDGSGSMSSRARWSASVGWAAANAAAQLPESRTVSVVYGAMAQVTQKPGHDPIKKVAVSQTNAGSHNFAHAAKLVEEALWLSEETEEGEPTNVLVIVVSDLVYGTQEVVNFNRITKDWVERGYQIVVVGARHEATNQLGIDLSGIEHVNPNQLFV